MLDQAIMFAENWVIHRRCSDCALSPTIRSQTKWRSIDELQAPKITTTNWVQANARGRLRLLILHPRNEVFSELLGSSSSKASRHLQRLFQFLVWDPGSCDREPGS